MLERGRVVISLRGRDRGRLLAVLRAQGSTVILADGKERPVDRPKAKNIRHIEATDIVLGEEAFISDRHLRRALNGIQMN